MSEAELRETVLAAIVAAVQVNTERYRAGAAFDVEAIASFVVDEIAAAGYVIIERGRVERLEKIERWAQSWGMDEDDLCEHTDGK